MVRLRVCITVLGVVCGTFLAAPASRADFLVSNASGTTIDNVSAAGVVTVSSSGYSVPRGLVLSPSGTTLYIGNNGNGTVSNVAPSGGTPTTLIPSSAGVSPYGMATDSSGKIYVADSTNNRISQFNSDGTVFNLNFITGLTMARGVAVDSSGNVYVSSGSNFERFSSAGGSTPNLTVSGFTFALGVTLGSGSSAGFAFVTDNITNNVYKVDLSGTGSKTLYNTSGTTLSAPNFMTFDSNGNLFVTNHGSNSISEISPLGVTSTFATSGLSLEGPSGIVFVNPAPTPEPSSILLLSGLGLGMARAYRRWSRRRD